MAVPGEQRRPDVRRRRSVWPRLAAGKPIRRFVLLDESSAHTELSTIRGRGLKGARVHSPVPCGRWPTATMVGGLRGDGPCAPMMLGGPMNGDSFLAYGEQALIPALSPGDVVVMDNLSTRKAASVLAAFETHGAEALFLPPYSPDLNPIENMWPKVKSLIRRHASRTLHGLMYAMAEALEAVTPQDCRGHIRNARYRFHDIS